MQQPPAWIPPMQEPKPNRTSAYVAVVIAVVLLAAVGGAAWWVSSNPRQPAAKPTVATSTPADPSNRARHTCRAAWKLAKVELPKLEAFPPVIALAGISGEPELEKVAADYPNPDYLDARAALRAIAAWCDDHDVEWPNGQ